MLLLDAVDEHWRSLVSVQSNGYWRLTSKEWLHRAITGAGKGQIVDHINRDKSDNRKINLRLTDRHGNARNSKMRSHNTSGFRGVHMCKCTGLWRAEVRVNGKGKKLGRFSDKTEAARVYDRAAKIYHGAFAVLNFPASKCD